MGLKNFNSEQFEDLFSNIIDQKIAKSDIKKILLEINDNGYSSHSFLGAMACLKKRMRKINAPQNAVDVCGTGGDGLETLNISTAVCFVVAAADIVVAKHGNKAISSKSGSADIFVELGIKISSEINEIEKNLREKKLCFLFAPFFHESLRNLAEIRKEIAQEFNMPTIFNYLGPLLNPANTALQMIGTSKQQTMLPMIQALKINGSKRVYVVHGFDKMDEITICDKSYLLKLDDGKISEEIIDPQDYAIAKTSIEALKGKDPSYNAKKLLQLFLGEKSAYRDIVVLNSAFVLQLANPQISITDAITEVQNLIDSGKAYQVLSQLKAS